MSSPYSIRTPQKTSSNLRLLSDSPGKYSQFLTPNHRVSNSSLELTLGVRTPMFRTPKTPNLRIPHNFSTSPGLASPYLTPTGESTPFLTPRSRQRISDRYIPNRSVLDVETSHHYMFNVESPKSPRSLGPVRVLPFTLQSSRQVVPSVKFSKNRKVHLMPERIMAAPGVIEEAPQCIAWDPSPLMAVSLAEGIYICNPADQYSVQHLKSVKNLWFFTCLAWNAGFSPQLLAASDEQVLEIWDVNKKQSLYTLQTPSIGSVVWQKKILACAASGKVHYLDPVNFNPISALTTTSPVSALCLSSSEHLLVCGHENGRISVWDYRAHNHALLDFSAHESQVQALAWCPFTNAFASGSGDPSPTIRLWSGLTGQPADTVHLRALDKPSKSMSEVTALVWSAQYQELASAHGNSCPGVLLWNKSLPEPVAKFAEHTDKVAGLAVNPEGTTLASLGEDELSILWKCWPPRKTKKSTKTPSSVLTMGSIR